MTAVEVSEPEDVLTGGTSGSRSGGPSGGTSGSPAGDVAALADDYVSLARVHAASGDTRAAVLATWAADVLAVQTLLWESGLGSAPDPDAELLAVGEAVLASVAQVAEDTLRAEDTEHTEDTEQSAVPTPRQLVEGFRRSLAATFDPSVHALLDARFAPLDHLDGLGLPAAGAGARAAAARLEGATAEQLAWDLRLAAGDCVRVAAALDLAGDVQEAARQRTAAATAAFEAHLLHAAMAAEDAHLCTVDLRWDLVASRMAGAVTGDERRPALRERMLDGLLPAERPSLAQLFGESEVR